MNRLEQLKKEVAARIHYTVGSEMSLPQFLKEEERAALIRKRESVNKRGIEIVKSKAKAVISGEKEDGHTYYLDYLLHFEHLLKRQNRFYLEEEIEERQAVFTNNQLFDDKKLNPPQMIDETPVTSPHDIDTERQNFQYDRRAVVQYAEEWWNRYNPNYKKFAVDCTNYVSQCLRAGGAPMTGFGAQDKGWWYEGDSWSYSWAVAHSLRWYLSGAKSGLRAQEVESAKDLRPGDVICYDFEGDGRFDHTTIVVALDENDEPLVNAHTYNSRMRYWKYEDSTAWTPDIQYKFFHIIDNG